MLPRHQSRTTMAARRAQAAHPSRPHSLPAPLFLPPPPEPWLHVATGAGFAYSLGRLAAIYDDSTDVLNRQLSGYAALPSWAHAQLAPEQLDAELRERRLAEAADKFERLAELEERDFLAARAAKRAALA